MSSIFLFSTSRIFLPDICAQPFHAFCRMRKKHPVCRTQLIQPRLSIHKRLAPSAAAASAQRKIRTFMTGCTDRSGSLHKCFCFFRSFHLYKSIVHGSQFPLIHAWMRSNGRMGRRSAAFMRWNRSSMENFCVSCLICGMRILPQGRR